MYISPFSCAPIDIEIQGTRANCRSRDTIPTLRQHPKQENVDEDGAGEEHRDAETPFRGKSSNGRTVSARYDRENEYSYLGQSSLKPVPRVP